MSAQQTSVTTSPEIAFAGMVGDDRAGLSVSAFNEEASAELAFGRMVAQGTTESGVLKIAANTDVCAGVVKHAHGYAKDTQLGSTGLKSGVMMEIHVEGPIWVQVDEDIDAGDPVRVRDGATGGATAGNFCTTADSTTILLKNARYLRDSRTLASGTKIALVDLNMTGIGTAVAE